MIKKLLYIISFTILGILLQFLIHAGLEIWYIGLLNKNFGVWGLGLNWTSWYTIHHIFTIMLLAAGIFFGFWQGQFWWKRLYEQKNTGKKKKVVAGGTFDLFHKGHEALLAQAAQLGKVTVGITSDEMAERIKDRKVARFSEREGNVEAQPGRPYQAFADGDAIAIDNVLF